MIGFNLYSTITEPISEDTRLRELFALDILDTPRDARFDEILDRICDDLGAQSARVSLIDADRIWVKSSKGMPHQSFPRHSSIEDHMVSQKFEIFCTKNHGLELLVEPFIEANPDITFICAIAIRSLSGAPVGALVLGFLQEQMASDDLKKLLLASAAKYSDLLEARRVADSLLATMRDQQEELRIRYSSERIARTLTNPVLTTMQYRQVIESFAQTILNEFDWWGCQLWFENEGQLFPEKWILGPSAPRTLQLLNKHFIAPMPSPLNSDNSWLAYSSNISSILAPDNLDWLTQKDQLETLGGRSFIQVDVAGVNNTAIRLLFLLPSSRSFPPRLKLTFDNVVAILPQVLRRARSTEEINYRATHDELTGLLNRRGLDVEFSKRPTHDGINTSRSVFFLDIDRFKEINDTYGHQVGDEYLVEISQRLMKSSRPVDAIARIGGDEFVIVAQGFDLSDDIVKASNRFLESLGATFTTVEGIEIEPRVSIGISSWDITENLSVAIAQADKNMYLAKGRGGHQAVSDGWNTNDPDSIANGEIFSISYQRITDKSAQELFGILARVQLPVFFAPKVITEIAQLIFQKAESVFEDGAARKVLLLDVVTVSRSDRANTLALVDSIAELSRKNSDLSVVINLDSTIADGVPLAREIMSHGTARIALGNVFDVPFDLTLIDELQPTFFIRSTLSLDWSRGDFPVIADRTALAVAADLNIAVILPIEYSERYAEFLEKFPNTQYFAGPSERQT